MPTIEFPDGMTVEDAIARTREQRPDLFADARPGMAVKPAAPGRGLEAEPLLTPAEVAALFRVDSKTVTRWAKRGWLTSIRTLGGHRRYRESEVAALLAGIPKTRDEAA